MITEAHERLHAHRKGCMVCGSVSIGDRRHMCRIGQELRDEALETARMAATPVFDKTQPRRRWRP